MTPSSAEPIVVSWSEIDTFRQCPHKHRLGYQERWTSQGSSPALTRGIMWHALLEYHYKSLQECPGDLERAGRVAWEFALRDPRAVQDQEVLDLLMWMYTGYVEQWGADPDWEILAVEERYHVPLLTASGQRSRFVLKMGIDLAVKDRSMRNRIFLVDHKTGANLPAQKELDLADQFSTYMWGLRRSGMDVFGAMWNGARTKRNIKPMAPTDRFARPLLARTDYELDTVAREAYATARTMYSPRNLAERHPDPDTCKWKCSYVEACLMGRKTGDVKEREYLADAGFRQDWTRH